MGLEVFPVFNGAAVKGPADLDGAAVDNLGVVRVEVQNLAAPLKGFGKVARPLGIDYFPVCVEDGLIPVCRRLFGAVYVGCRFHVRGRI